MERSSSPGSSADPAIPSSSSPLSQPSGNAPSPCPPSPAGSSRTVVGSGTAACAVCQEPLAKARVHYGAVTCYSCRAFFRRASLRGEERVCLKQGSCMVLLKDRKECIYCRYEKCLEAGMSMSLILSEEGKRQRFKRYFEKKDVEAATQQEERDSARAATTARPRAATAARPRAASTATGPEESAVQSPQRTVRQPSFGHQLEMTPPKLSRVTFPPDQAATRSTEDQEFFASGRPSRASVLVQPSHARNILSQERETLPTNHAEKGGWGMGSHPQMPGNNFALPSHVRLPADGPWALNPAGPCMTGRQASAFSSSSLIDRSLVREASLKAALHHVIQGSEIRRLRNPFQPTQTESGRRFRDEPAGEVSFTRQSLFTAGEQIQRIFARSPWAQRDQESEQGERAVLGSRILEKAVLGQQRRIDIAEEAVGAWHTPPDEEPHLGQGGGPSAAARSVLRRTWPEVSTRRADHSHLPSEREIFSESAELLSFPLPGGSAPAQLEDIRIDQESASYSTTQLHASSSLTWRGCPARSTRPLDRLHKLDNNVAQAIGDRPAARWGWDILDCAASPFTGPEATAVCHSLQSPEDWWALPSSGQPSTSHGSLCRAANPISVIQNTHWPASRPVVLPKAAEEAQPQQQPIDLGIKQAEADFLSPASIKSIRQNISVERRRHLAEENDFDLENVHRFLQYNHKKFRKRPYAGVRDELPALIFHEAVLGVQAGRSSVIMTTRRFEEARRNPGEPEEGRNESRPADEPKLDASHVDELLGLLEDDQKLLELVYSLDVAQVEGIFTLEEERCVTKQNSEFWENWQSFNVGAKLMTTWLQFIQHGGQMDPVFYTLVHRQMRARVISSFFALEDRFEILLQDAATLLCQNVSQVPMLNHILSFNIGDPIEVTTHLALGRQDLLQWEEAGRLRPPSAAELTDMMPLLPTDKLQLFILYNSFTSPFFKDFKVFYMMVAITLLNPEGLELLDRSAVVRMRSMYMGMLSRYLAHHYNSPIAERKVYECIAALPQFESLFLKGCPAIPSSNT